LDHFFAVCAKAVQTDACWCIADDLQTAWAYQVRCFRRITSSLLPPQSVDLQTLLLFCVSALPLTSPSAYQPFHLAVKPRRLDVDRSVEQSIDKVMTVDSAEDDLRGGMMNFNASGPIPLLDFLSDADQMFKVTLLGFDRVVQPPAANRWTTACVDHIIQKYELGRASKVRELVYHFPLHIPAVPFHFRSTHHRS
jgi:hypothetical protein